MAGLNDWMGPTQVLGPRERQALIEAGVMTREDFMDKPAPKPTPVQPPVGGSSAQADLAKSLGLTVPQLIAKQDAQKREMMRKQNDMARKLKGYAGGGMVGALGRIARKLGSEAAPARRGVTDIIKERGGQWINGSVEDALKSTLKTSVSGMSPEDRLAELQKYAPNVTRPESIEALNVDMARQQRNIALNNWTKGPLTKHIKRDMGTANDPFVKLADQGIMVNEAPYTHNAGGPLKIKRSRQGYNPYGDAKTEAGKAWENTNDTLITQQSAADFRKLPYMLEENPWLATLADDTPVHSIGEDALYEGGIAHLLDEIGNAVDPESGLPAHLRITPDQLRSGNFSVDTAIRRVSDINKWRADVTTAANQARANNAATHLHKDYGDGFKWVQLKAPEWKAPEGHQYDSALDAYVEPFAEENSQPVKKPRDYGSKELQDALKYEGDTMKHCVGGYADDVACGRSQIYSLRDANGQPHATIETKPGSETSFWDLPDDKANQYYARAAEEVRKQKGLRSIPDDVQSNDKYDALHDAILEHANSLYEADVPENMPAVIVQIKGKANSKPIDKYLPYVQDFVKSGQWSDVGDLQNTGLSHRSSFPSLTDGPEYLTPDEVAAARVKLGLDPTLGAGYAQGGMIPMRNRKAELRSAELAKLRAPELKASPTLPEWLMDMGRGIGAAFTEGFPHAIGNTYNELKGLPTVPSAYKQQPGVFQDELENSWAKAIPENLLDPSNLVGFEAAKPVAKALPALLAAGATGYSPEAEAGKLGALGRIARRLAGPAERGATIVRDVALHAPGPAVSAKSYEASDLGALMDALAPYVKPGMLKKQDGDSIFGQAIENISDPDGPVDALTTVLFGADGTPQAYHQVSPKGGAMSEADYLAFLGSISGQNGAGEQALRHSLDNSSGEVSFYPTPGAQKFYDKMATRIPGMRKVQGDGNNVDSMAWSRKDKAAGGVVDYNDLHGY